MFKVKKEDIRATSTVCSPFSNVFIVKFEMINTDWKQFSYKLPQNFS